MSKTRFLKDLASQLTDALPSHLGRLKKDVEKNCQTILVNGLTDKFDLVSRKEFDAQSKVLARIRKKCEALEKQLDVLEASLKNVKPKRQKK